MYTNSEQIQQLIESNNELENYFRNTIIPQLYIDGELRLRKCTPPAMAQFSLSQGDIGRPVSDMKGNLRFPSIGEDIQRVIQTKEILEKEIQTTDLRWFQMNIIPFVIMRNNTTDGVIITFIDITMRIKDLKVQEKLIAENAILLDTISHDIRNPLTNMFTAVEMLKSVPYGDEKSFTSLFKIVESAMMKMHKLIIELTADRKEDFTGISEVEVLNFEHVLENVRITLSDNFRAANASLSRNIGVSEIIFSRRKLRTVMYNLINNAIKFKSTKRKPKIVVTTFREKNFIVISVRDNGLGIDCENVDKIFAKYHKLDDTIEGSGIGLYLIKEILTNEGGKITVESQLGKGSEFKVYIRQD